MLGGTGGLGQRSRAVTDDGASVLAADTKIPAPRRGPAPGQYVTVDVLDEASVRPRSPRRSPASAAAAGHRQPDRRIHPAAALSDLDIWVLRHQLELNLVTAAIVTKHAMPLLAAQDGGPLVHVRAGSRRRRRETASPTA